MLLICSFHCYSSILLLIPCLRIYLIYLLLLFIYLFRFYSFTYCFILFPQLLLFVCLSVYFYVLCDVYICYSYSLIRFYLLASLGFHSFIYLSYFHYFLLSNLSSKSLFYLSIYYLFIYLSINHLLSNSCRTSGNTRSRASKLYIICSYFTSLKFFRTAILSRGEGEHFHINLYGTCRFSGYHFSA